MKEQQTNETVSAGRCCLDRLVRRFARKVKTMFEILTKGQPVAERLGFGDAWKLMTDDQTPEAVKGAYLAASAVEDHCFMMGSTYDDNQMRADSLAARCLRQAAREAICDANIWDISFVMAKIRDAQLDWHSLVVR
jgi:hypothetical protein